MYFTGTRKSLYGNVFRWDSKKSLRKCISLGHRKVFMEMCFTENQKSLYRMGKTKQADGIDQDQTVQNVQSDLNPAKVLIFVCCPSEMVNHVKLYFTGIF